MYKTSKDASSYSLRPAREKLALEHLKTAMSNALENQGTDSSYTAESIPIVESTNITTFEAMKDIQGEIYLITHFINTQTLEQYMSGKQME